MKYPQLPQTPAGINPVLRQWLDAAAKMLRPYFEKGANGVPTRGELSSAGVVTVGGDGTITGPGKGGLGVVTVPPAVTGLTARGAMAAIYLSWDAPPFTNFANIVIMRSDTDDYGTAYAVGSAVKGVTGYVDNVGSGATKYYWIYAATTSGVNGPPNAVHGTRGHTGYDPSYVMSVLTSYLWVANTGYEPYQYVRPTTANGFQYVCVDGGTSGATEPTWPVGIGNTVIDGTCEWKCEKMTARVPFAIGTVDGMPAVTILNAFIEDASITTAQIKDLAADKITAGKIQANVDINLKGYLWNGFSAFANTLDVPGFWFGMDGSTPKFKLTSGAPGGDHGITFDGTNLTVTGDGTFDDVFGDSSRFNIASANRLLYSSRVVESDYISEHSIKIDNPDYNRYLCVTEEVFVSATTASHDFGVAYLVNISGTPTVAWDSSYITSQPVSITTSWVNGIVAYDTADSSTTTRFKDYCSFIVRLNGVVCGYPDVSDIFSTLYLVFDPGGTTFGINLLPKWTSIYAATESSPHVFSVSGPAGSHSIEFSAFLAASGIILTCHDTGKATGFTDANGHRMNVSLVIYPKHFFTPGTPIVTYPNTPIALDLQLWKPEYSQISNVPSDGRLY